MAATHARSEEKQMIFAVLTFTICFAVIYTVYWAFILRPEAQTAGQVRRRLDKDHVRRVGRSELLKQARALSSIGVVDALLQRGQSRTERLQILIDQAGLKITVGTLAGRLGHAGDPGALSGTPFGPVDERRARGGCVSRRSYP